MVWTQDELLTDLGLSRRTGFPGKSIYIDKAEVDPRSRGAVAVISESALDHHRNLQTLNLRYWAIYPGGRSEKQNLFELETETLPDGKLDISRLHILGREINTRDPENVDNAVEAIKRIHIELRKSSSKVPNVAKIFEECGIRDVANGDSLPLPGFDAKEGINFPVSRAFTVVSGKTQPPPKVLLPYEAVKPLCGACTNTLDQERSYLSRTFLAARGVIPLIKKRFAITSRVEMDGEGGTLTLDRRATGAGHDEEAVLAAMRWKKIKADKENGFKASMAELTTLKLFNQNILTGGRPAAMNALGVLNRTHADMLEAGADYPRLQDHLASFDLLNVAQSSGNPPPPAGRFIIESKGGNNVREIVPGVGEDIGGNCKKAETQWIDAETGDTRRMGVILDFGAYLIRKRSHWTGAVPDVVEDLKHCKHICITHHHLDHLDALIPYVKRGFLTDDHTVHMTREVFEMAKDKFRKWQIPEHKWPKFHLLDGTGAFDLSDEKGVKRMTVMYGADAVPHSARCTPFTVYGRNGGSILGSYTYLGDMRYDEDWFKVHASPFWDPMGFMSKREPHLNRDHLLPTYSEIDLTSVKRQGRSPTERTVEDNLTHILNNWFPDRHAGLAMIGTADGRRETLLNVGNRTQRKMTTFGAAVDFIFRIANKHGVNPYRLPRPEEGTYTGIDDYLSWHAEQNELTPTTYIRRTAGAVKKWFKQDRPGSILAVLSGSQGNRVEIESMTYKLSEGRSFWDADPKTSKTARPASLKNWAIIFTQSAIPGNGRDQQNLIRRLVRRGALVLEAYGDGTRVHNPGKLKDRILADLQTQGHAFTVEDGTGAIHVPGLTIHASGHGRREDFKLWLEKIQSKMFGGHHTDDMESVNIAYDEITARDKKHPGTLFENYQQIEVTNQAATVIGRTTPSVVLTREEQEDGKQYNKRLRATRVIVQDDRSPQLADLGLRGSAGGANETHFGAEDAEEARNDNARALDAKVPDTRSSLSRAKPWRQDEGVVAVVRLPWGVVPFPGVGPKKAAL